MYVCVCVCVTCRELLDDENFQESLAEVKKEPILYFQQFNLHAQSNGGQEGGKEDLHQRSDSLQIEPHKHDQGPRTCAPPEKDLGKVLGEADSQAAGITDTKSIMDVGKTRELG